jgi:hypothetical protein
LWGREREGMMGKRGLGGLVLVILLLFGFGMGRGGVYRIGSWIGRGREGVISYLRREGLVIGTLNRKEENSPHPN